MDIIAEPKEAMYKTELTATLLPRALQGFTEHDVTKQQSGCTHYPIGHEVVSLLYATLLVLLQFIIPVHSACLSGFNRSAKSICYAALLKVLHVLSLKRLKLSASAESSCVTLKLLSSV